MSDYNGEKVVKLVNRNQRYYKNIRGTVFLEHDIHVKNVPDA